MDDRRRQNTYERPFKFRPACRDLFCSFSLALLLPLSAEAQPVLSVSPTSVSVQANAGTNAPSQTVRVKQRGKPTAQVVGCAGECELAQRIADERRERRYAYVDLHNVRAGGRAVSDLVPRPEHNGIGYHSQCAGELVACALAPPPPPLDR